MKTITAIRLALFIMIGANIGCTSLPFDPELSLDVYRIRSGDLVRIEVFKEPDISVVFSVSAKGEINHPLLGKVQIAGLSIAEAESRIIELLSADYLVDPIVTVTVSNSSLRPVMLFGEVRRPGTYNIEAGKRYTLLQVIARAGGFTDIAARDRVRIVRVIEGQERVLKVRVSDLLRGRNGLSDIDLSPGDVVTVPETIF
jgi:protein involved in polysaccharide export with SLBB domain